MHAENLAVPVPTVGLETPAAQAAQLLAGENLPGLVVVDDQNRPVTTLPATQVLRMAVPRYIQDDPPLARVVDEATADLFLTTLADRTVRECLATLPRERELPVVDPDATVLEVAALMARCWSPLVAVAGADGMLLGAITLDALLDRVLAA